MVKAYGSGLVLRETLRVVAVHKDYLNTKQLPRAHPLSLGRWFYSACVSKSSLCCLADRIDCSAFLVKCSSWSIYSSFDLPILGLLFSELRQ